jgi:hypothetical protein
VKKQVYEIDEYGFLKEIYVAEFDKEGNPKADLSANIVTVDPPNGLYRAKWTGTEWAEDMTQEEIEELNNQTREKTKLEILQEAVDTLVLSSLGVL